MDKKTPRLFFEKRTGCRFMVRLGKRIIGKLFTEVVIYPVDLLLLILEPVDFRGASQCDGEVALIYGCSLASGDLADGDGCLVDVCGPYEIGDAGFERSVFLLGERGGVVAEDRSKQGDCVHTLESYFCLVSYGVCGEFFDCDFILLTHDVDF